MMCFNKPMSLLLAACIPALTACGGGESSSPASASPSSTLQTETLALTGGSAEQTAGTAATTTTTTSDTAVTTETLLKSFNTWTAALIQMAGGVAIRIKGTVESATVGPVRIEGPKYALYTETGAIIRNLNVHDFEAVELQREGIRLRGDVNGVTIRNFNIRMRAQQQVSPDLPIGISIYEGSNITISDGYIGGFQMVTVPGTYTNGDGIATERPVNSILIERVTSNDNSDAGFDLKSSNTVLNDTHAERNKRNYRLWATVRTGTIYSGTPLVNAEAAHVWVNTGADVVIDKLVATSTTTAPVLYIEPDAKSVTVNSCELDVPVGTKFFIGGKYTVKSFGPGCAL
ncbi:right-handed parallel beta-helix repeat-containing protein [Rhizorhapis sp.]|uniref:right-handed parallel beta-helix repeat-containing protein n=1 Tax=Rhizorhapis sp. TaxID=1968842 RepID=UPI002B49B487|nr:right-handed parallel beta-helix repeat-containing protein [Rhizorhapis sp.]HKR16477.1 right-handed parallel beta-helix repeat-containing protein [Rhizorhapis sp.]